MDEDCKKYYLIAPMLSSRLQWHLKANRLSRILARKRAAGEAVLDLTESNPTRAGFLYPEAGVIAAVSRPGLMAYEPDPAGGRAARKAVASYYRAHAREVDPSSLILTAGTSEGYGFLFKLLADPGEEILVPQPSYPLLESLIALEGLRLVPYPLRYEPQEGWRLDLERLRLMASTRTRAVAVVNPNNPTGSFLRKSQLAELNGICRALGLALIVDEVFLDFRDSREPDILGSAVGNREVLTFVLSGLSKIVCLPQVKLGWIQVSGPEPLATAAREGLELIADTYLTVSTAVQLGTDRLLALRETMQKQVQARLATNQSLLAAAAARLPEAAVLVREGGWYAVLHLDDPLSDEERSCLLLEELGVYVLPGYFFDFPRDGFLVLSLLTPPPVFAEGVARLLAAREKREYPPAPRGDRRSSHDLPAGPGGGRPRGPSSPR